QLRVAAGEPLPLAQKDIPLRGHAIEARIYAEDPQREFLPATGRIAHLVFPSSTPSIRVDTGVEAGAEITPWYDPMIAKLIVRASDRSRAVARLRQALAEVEIAGVTTNVAFLRRVVASRALASAELDPGLIERNRKELMQQHALSNELLAAAAFAELDEEERGAREHAGASADPHSPWHRVDGWRLNQDSHHDFTFVEGSTTHSVRLLFLESGLRIAVNGETHALPGERLPDGRLLVRLDARAFKARAVREGSEWHIFCDGDHRRLALRQGGGGGRRGAAARAAAAPPRRGSG